MKQGLINWLLIAAFIFASLGQLARISIDATTHFYLFEPVLAVALVLLVSKVKEKPFQSLLLYRFSWGVKLFLGWAAFSLFFSSFAFSVSANVTAVLYFVRLLMYLVAIPYIVYWFKESSFLRNQSAIIIPVMMLFFVASSVVQYVYYPNLRNLSYLGWDPHYFRLFGVYFEPVIHASIAGILLICSFYLAQRNKLYSTGIVVFLGFIMASFSRAAYVGLVATTVSFVGHFLKKKYIVGAIIGVFLVAGVLFILPKPSGEGVQLLRTSTIFSRFTDYEEGIKVWQTAPILGIGYNHIGAVKVTPQNQPGLYNNAIASFHSSFLIILATTGAIGLLLFLSMIWNLMKVHKFFFYSLIYVGVVSLFDNVLLHPFILITIAYVGGYVVSQPSRT